MVFKMKAARRAATIEYAIRDVVIPARALEQKGIKVTKLNIGDPNVYDFDTPQHMKDALYEATMQGYNGYSPSEGDAELVKAISEVEGRKHGMNVNPDDICVTTGVTESLQMLFAAILEPGDNILVPGPGYPPYTGLPKLYDATPVPYRTIEEEGWNPDVDDIRKKINNRTTAIAVINPNNPTGAVYSPKVLKEIADIAAENKLLLISDEIYDGMSFKPFTSPLTLAKDVPMVVFNGFSKIYLAPGWRIGYTVFNNPNGFLDDVKKAYMNEARLRLCANFPAQRACIAALKGPQDHIPATIAKIKERANYAYKRLNEIPGISTAKPEGAFYIFPKIEALSNGPCDRWKDDKEFVLDVLNKAHVLFVHGSGFCPTYGKGHFRAVILPPMDVLEKAFDALDSFMRNSEVSDNVVS
jgi:aspartate/methionine/tyrosine aminotransferase